MSNRSEVLEHIDDALDRLRPFDNDAALGSLRQRLNELLKPNHDLCDPPWVPIHSIFVGQSGTPTAIAEPLHIQEDIFGWCRYVEAYLGDCLSIEPAEEVDVKRQVAMREPEALREATNEALERQRGNES